ncbi:MAG: hypothetical protein C0425_05285 [Chlorobiaceae bacterium]|nr:hypothetical protein [Chlorobiaceae bacterium]MBA4309730.1 hypothetical protein [Chlorobiaceae bacterium]
MKNEEDNLGKLITSLSEQNYPSELFEIILVDDSSTDNTFSRAKKIIEGKNNFRIISASKKIMQGKRGALQVGINSAKHNFILITDADCTHSKNWIQSMATALSENDFVFGIAPFIQKKSLTNLISCYENFRAFFLMFSLCQLGFPYSSTARSLGFRKETFNKINGYDGTDKTISGDDDLLLQKFVMNKKKISEVTNSFVYSETKESFKDYINQRGRHTKSSFHYSLATKSILALWHLINLLSVFSILFFALSINFIFPFLLKIIFDIYSTIKHQNKFGYNFKIYEIFFLQIIYELMLVVNLFSSILITPKWK